MEHARQQVISCLTHKFKLTRCVAEYLVAKYPSIIAWAELYSAHPEEAAQKIMDEERKAD